LERVFNDIEMNYQKQNIMEKIMTVSLSFRTHTHTLTQPHKLKDMPHTGTQNPTHTWPCRMVAPRLT